MNMSRLTKFLSKSDYIYIYIIYSLKLSLLCKIIFIFYVFPLVVIANNKW